MITTTYAGNASRSRHPRTVDEEIRRAAKKSAVHFQRAVLPEDAENLSGRNLLFNHLRARGASFYPGARLKESHIVTFTHQDWYEVLRFFFFVLSDNLV